MSVRVRFAPSPTGPLHLGNLRTALFGALFARKTGGSFILRLDDTDRTRSREEYERSILDNLNWLGLSPDEGWGVGGPHEPYRQSEATEIYNQALAKLKAANYLYPCYCGAEETEAHVIADEGHAFPSGYSGKCAGLGPEDHLKFEAEGVKAAIRFRLPAQPVTFRDAVRGPVHIEHKDLGGDFILRRADGTFLYNLACVADDIRMGITHIIRGEEFIETTARQLLLFKALGAQPPVFAHVASVTDASGKKLSKRSGGPALAELRQEGILPSAVIEALSRLGWSPQEVDPTEGLLGLSRGFALEKLSVSKASFDPDALRRINGQHLRALDPADFAQRAYARLSQPERAWVDGLGARAALFWRMFQPRLERLGEISEKAAFLFAEAPPVDPEARSLYDRMEGRPLLQALLERLGERSETDLPSAEREIEAIGQRLGRKGRELYLPIRIAVTGGARGPELNEIYELMGHAWMARRIETFLNGERPASERSSGARDDGSGA